MPRTGNILVHSLEFQVTTLKEIIHTHSRHIQKSVIAGTVTVKEVITQGSLQTGSYKVAALYITTQVIVPPLFPAPGSDLLAGQGRIFCQGIHSRIPVTGWAARQASNSV